jgi:uncharacterized protein YidB (DUF937 family)
MAMSILDDLMTTLSEWDASLHPRLAQALEGLLGGGIGLDEVLARLQATGLGGIVDSWLGDGTNLPISPDQLRGALGDEDVEAAAHRAGMPAQTLLEELAEHLPSLVDRLSPRGELLPAGASPTSLV